MNIAREIGEFHQRDGWRFQRLDDGSVRIRHHDLEHIIPTSEWVSIVASVAAEGDTAATYAAALQLHG